MVLKQRFTVSCDHRNFTECDRCILNLLRQYLMQTDKDNPAFSQWKQILTQFKEAFEEVGVIIVTPEGQVQFMTQQGEKLLSQYFSPYPLNSLPEPLQYWFKHQILLFTSNGKVPSPYLPLHIEKGRKELLVYLISDLIGEKYLVLLEEQELQSFSISSLELLGLTKREAEVLFWIAKDKSNDAIAKVLGCSQGTVRKHLEHIHEKLGVQTRTAAVMVALEKLGLLKGSFVAISS
ncbi:helix-turn-helix transcriptional regulator [Mastigocoleus sp. MO_188.B34]|uniref:helix-turn-helix transcriptional regulator n=1 Tax=Mastigocoleus sp. MO_188.B34 TaxID=3036635 RepID=UPI0026212676|nr:helix-turn-helix transcriptional regulator [Mastigocoleus sp. MO_188.B34]MDJ0694909.1 helix-turn-helix transcriptional regulator [Mastigocoleus sp. MO_188.B34]